LQAQVKAIVRRPLADDPATSDSMVAGMLNDALRSFQRRFEWRCLEGQVDSTLSAVVGNPYLALPANYKEKGKLYRRDSQGRLTLIPTTALLGGGSALALSPQTTPVPVSLGSVYESPRVGEARVTPDLIRGTWPDDAATGAPQCWCVDGPYILLGPAPDQTYDFTLYFNGYLAPLVLPDDTNWFTANLPRAIINEAVGMALVSRGEGQEAQGYFALAQRDVGEQLQVEAMEKARRARGRGPTLRGGYM